MNPNPSTPVKLAQKVGRSRPAEPAPQAVVESPAPEGKKLSLGGIIASVVVGLAVGIAALLTGATLVLAGGIFIGAVLLLLAFLSGTITMSSLMS